MFNLQKDLIFFDLEATGPSVVRDRIVQIAMVKYSRNGEITEFETLVNPGIPISEEAYKVHGISSSDVANKPTFQQLAQKIMDFIGDGDLAGSSGSSRARRSARGDLRHQPGVTALLQLQRQFLAP